MAERLEFVTLAQQEGVCLAELCRRYAISRTTASTWLDRAARAGEAEVADHYQVSPRPFPRELPPLVSGPDDAVRTVQADGDISFRGAD